MKEEDKKNEGVVAVVKSWVKRPELRAFAVVFVVVFLVLVLSVAYPVIRKRADFAQDQQAGSVEGEVFSCERAFLDMESNTLCIPKLEVVAPVNEATGMAFSDVLEQLKTGVALADGTARPGGEGNAFIIGHSNDYPWRDGDYKQVFALLDKLETGDSVFVAWQGEQYEYQVYDSLEVKPDELWVLQPDENKEQPTVSLMTCWPPSTTLKRYIVRAELVGS